MSYPMQKLHRSPHARLPGRVRQEAPAGGQAHRQQPSPVRGQILDQAGQTSRPGSTKYTSCLCVMISRRAPIRCDGWQAETIPSGSVQILRRRMG
jgi:hypothetical protein